MKKIKASIVIQPGRLDKIREILKQAGCAGSDMKGSQGGGGCEGLVWQWRIELLPKLHLEISAPDGEAQSLAQALLTEASRAQAADGEICFYEVEETKVKKEGKKEKGTFVKKALFSAPGSEIGLRRTAC